MLRRSVPYADARLEALAELARESPEQRFAAGELLWREGDPSGYGLMMVAGVVEGVAGAGRQRFRFSSRSVVGGLDSLAARPRWFDATALVDTVAIKVPTGALLDLFEDHVDMALDLLRVMAGEVLALRERIGADGSVPQTREAQGSPASKRPGEPWVRWRADEVGGAPHRDRPAVRECAKPDPGPAEVNRSEPRDQPLDSAGAARPNSRGRGSGANMSDKFRVLISDEMSDRAAEILAASPAVEVEVRYGLTAGDSKATIGEFDGLVVRSRTKVGADVIEAGKRLKIIGRAGIGVDNIDVTAASRRGIIVKNTPTGNAVTTAEHALCLLMSLARHIPQATASMKAGKWEKTKFSGSEIMGKTLGVVGLGNIGRIVADRARGLKMKVLGLRSVHGARGGGAARRRAGDIDELWPAPTSSPCTRRSPTRPAA